MADHDQKKTVGKQPLVESGPMGEKPGAETNPLDAAMGKTTFGLSGRDTRVTGNRATSGGDTR